jgi:hypothetical protein
LKIEQTGIDFPHVLQQRSRLKVIGIFHPLQFNEMS